MILGELQELLDEVDYLLEEVEECSSVAHAEVIKREIEIVRNKFNQFKGEKNV